MHLGVNTSMLLCPKPEQLFSMHQYSKFVWSRVFFIEPCTRNAPSSTRTIWRTIMPTDLTTEYGDKFAELATQAVANPPASGKCRSCPRVTGIDGTGNAALVSKVKQRCQQVWRLRPSLQARHRLPESSSEFNLICFARFASSNLRMPRAVNLKIRVIASNALCMLINL